MKNGENSLKKVDYSIMSNKKCKVCGRPLKQNVVQRNEHAVLCYVCFKISEGKTKKVQRRYADGKSRLISEKTIDYRKLQKENIKKYGLKS